MVFLCQQSNYICHFTRTCMSYMRNTSIETLKHVWAVLFKEEDHICILHSRYSNYFDKCTKHVMVPD